MRAQPEQPHTNLQSSAIIPQVIEPSQVWRQLTPVQQHQALQRLVQVCQHLTQPAQTKEVPGERR
jgi:hypothetical protein